MAQVFRKLFWTEHSKIKIRQYGLSKQKITGILRKPEREERGIAPGTTAAMRTNKVWKPDKSQRSWHFDGPAIIAPKARLGRAPGEIWIMYKDVRKRSDWPVRKIISAWRYPGITKPGDPVPIPDDIRQELLNNIK